MKKLLVSLSTFALVVGALALPASAMPQMTTTTSKSVQPYATYTLPTPWIKHFIAPNDVSGGDTLTFSSHDEHGLNIKVKGSTQNLKVKISHAGDTIDTPFPSSGSGFFKVKGNTTTVYFYNKGGTQKNIEVRYTQ
ncbi:hypothetical protein [Brevibacillus laterosporus]|uniref:Uncharacterized protein n=1 Tax=Brevibacillus laterosporus TaxID=1465 RepID=A0AAP3DKR2_BRELA|nr:hypothetical protein [Brevibacillus laterosporus]MCR8982656.1 hypothetical protein [Brevibacillus laterosporus]MCZ0809812.1 hypothetical protein [Brevibacillus laterosporus]MCZ0828354.1 hypothetical protein [Brevibacillus laterosporus]MCZ0852364.1 hypothetical protein [Brevibacillus laterosporus]